MRFAESALVLAWVAILLLALGMSGLMRQLHQLGNPHSAEPLIGPLIGATLANLNETVIRPGRESVILFAEASCDSCEAVLPALGTIARTLPDTSFAIVLPNTGRPSNSPSDVTVHENRLDLFELVQVPATPFAVALDENGVVKAASMVGRLGDWKHS